MAVDAAPDGAGKAARSADADRGHQAVETEKHAPSRPGRRPTPRLCSVRTVIPGPDVIWLSPAVSSERREYVPVGYLDSRNGGEQSAVHGARRRSVHLWPDSVPPAHGLDAAGERTHEVGLPYTAKTSVYNTFPWPDRASSEAQPGAGGGTGRAGSAGRPSEAHTAAHWRRCTTPT